MSRMTNYQLLKLLQDRGCKITDDDVLNRYLIEAEKQGYTVIMTDEYRKEAIKIMKAGSKTFYYVLENIIDIDEVLYFLFGENMRTIIRAFEHENITEKWQKFIWIRDRKYLRYNIQLTPKK